MFGIGSSLVDLNAHSYRFKSVLGLDQHSWALSFSGKLQHNGQSRSYCQKISQGCIVGVCLDLTFGTLQFFLNRQALGVAFDNIPVGDGIQLYPMICSTAARSIIRLLNCTHKRESLQLRALQCISRQASLLLKLRQMTGLSGILRNYWFLAHSVRFFASSKPQQLDMLDEAVLSTAKRKKRTENEGGCLQMHVESCKNDFILKMRTLIWKICTKMHMKLCVKAMKAMRKRIRMNISMNILICCFSALARVTCKLLNM